MRKIMVGRLLEPLTPDEVNAIMHDDPGTLTWPGAARPKEFGAAYAKIADDINAAIERRLGRPLTPEELPNEKDHRNMKIAARKWTERFLRNGHIYDDPPHQKGYKMARNREHLAAIRRMILKGHKDRQGNTRLYSSLEELQSLQRDEFNQHFHATGLKTLRALWIQLQNQYPKLRRVALRLKKDRDAAAVKVCCYSV